MTVKATKISCTKEDLREAMKVDRKRRTTVLSFLLCAESENAVFEGRTAAQALVAACALLRISPDEIAKLREEII